MNVFEQALTELQNISGQMTALQNQITTQRNLLAVMVVIISSLLFVSLYKSFRRFGD